MKTLITRITQSSLAILACLVATPAAQAAYTTSAGTATSADAEAVTGGTFLNINNVSDIRNGLTLSAVSLGPNMSYTFTTDVNWSLNDSSDGSRLVGGRGVDDNNRRQTASPFAGASWSPFSVTLSGLTAGSTYGLQVVALGVRADTGGGQVPGLLDSTKPDFGINDYDFSYGASAGSLTTFANVAAGTLIYEEKSSTATSIDVGGGVFVNHWCPTRAWISRKPRTFLKEAAGGCSSEFKVFS